VQGLPNGIKQYLAVDGFGQIADRILGERSYPSSLQVDDSVTLGSRVSTKRAGDPKAMELERNLAKPLVSVDAFQGDGNNRALSSNGTVVAKFRSGK
jgi:hypothetical protein